MKKIAFLILATMLAIHTAAQQKSFYDFTVTTIEGETFPLSQLKGKKVMVVNVASKCGLTPQYEKLEALYRKYKDTDFVIIGFPANNFGAQEPGTNEEIQEFCTKNYGVSFPMMSKISVKDDDIDPLYAWLTTKEGNGKEDAPVTWNFQKFLIAPDGTWATTFAPQTDPMDGQIIDWIEGR